MGLIPPMICIHFLG